MSKELFEAEIMESLPPPLSEFDYYIVVACWRYDWWKIFPDKWTTKEKAEEEAAKLPKGYGMRYVFRLTNMNRAYIGMEVGKEAEDARNGRKNAPTLIVKP